MVTNKNKVTFGGSWLLLTLLMIGMSWSAAVSPVTENLQTSENDGAESIDDLLTLPDETINPADNDEFGYDAGAELIGSRTETAKTFLKDNGDFEVIVSPVPVHYMDEGSWEEIDLTIESNEGGWSVTQNTYETYFGNDARAGVQMVVDGQTIRYGIMPQVVVLDGNTLSPEPYMAKPSSEPIDVGANVIRYPMLTGISLDYKVTSTQLKQNLVIREAPMLLDHQKESGYFGIAETMILPTGFALFLGESPIADGELVKTNQSLSIRNLETGELLVAIPQPLVESIEPSEEGPHIGEYVIQVQGESVTLTTVVENTWLMDSDNRSFPIAIDPTMDKGAQRAGYAYYYRITRWGWYTSTYEYAFSSSSLLYTCRGSGSYSNTCTSSSYTWYYRYAWYRFDFNNALPTGATINSVDFKSNVGRYQSGARSFEVAVLKSGSSQSSNVIDPSSYLYSSGRYLNRYIRNSAASSSSTSLSDPGYYWNGGNVRSISMNSNGISDVQDAVDGNGAGSSGHILGLGLRNTANAPFWYWCSTGYYSYYGCTSATKYPHLHLDYSGGSDTAPPEDTFVAYTGLTTHRAEQRTFWLSLRDTTGVDTTTNGGPSLSYSVDNGSWTNVRATTLGTCLAGYWCNFRAVIPAVQEGEYVEYFWAFQDLVGTAAGTTGTPNFKTLPVGGTGSPSSVTAPSSPYNYFVQPDDQADAFNSDGTKNNKWQLKIDALTSFRYYSVYRYFDEQITYYEDSQEYIWEYDTSNCGTGSYQCFNTAGVYEMRYSPTISSYSYSNCAQSSTCKVTEPYDGYATSSAYTGQNGPGMSTIWWYNAADGAFAVVGLDDETGIDQPVSGAAVGTQGGARNCDDCYSAVPIPGDITMKFGTLSVNASYTSSRNTRNHFCVNSNNHPLYFLSSSSSNPYCLYSYSTFRYDRQFNGWMAPGYDGRWSGNSVIMQKVSPVRPMPDIYPPEFDHTGLMDTHSEDDRTVTVGMQDAGDPPTGMNTSSGTDANGVLEGPHMLYRVFNATSQSWGNWVTRAMSQEAGKTRAQCELMPCDWSATIPGTDRENTVEYSIHAKDNNGNWNNTTAMSYLIGTPTKVFTVEWHDMNCGFGQQYKCSYQVKMYDVTNEIEYHYDTGSSAYYDYENIGYQKGGSTAIGASLRERGPGYIAGANPYDYNYRIATDGNNHANEKMTVGMTELFNYDEVFTGTSNGWPYTYYCTRYWYNYRNQCGDVIDIPAGFDIDYFGTTYSGNSSHKLHVIRHGGAAFSTSTSTTPMQMAYYGWGGYWPEMPNTGSYIRNAQLTPWFGYYGAYYCYNSGSNECSIRTKTIPFDGAGMDVYADITEDTIWDAEMSPIRVVPSGDYLRVTANLVIDAGVEVQFAPGKGLDMAGTCSRLTTNGNATHPVTITNLGNSAGKGIAFTSGCADTDDRHMFNNTDFSNLDVAISAGSRHGNAPHHNGNVGNFTFDTVTFTDVGTAIKHGSGTGTGFDLSGVSITNATDSCIDLPDDAGLTWIEGSATNCNTGSSSSDGAIKTGDGSVIYLENLTITDAAHNGIIGDSTSMHASNVSMSTSGLSSTQVGGTGLGQTSTATSGTSMFANNVDAAGYANALVSYATDSMSLTDINGGSIQLAPGGTSGTMLGASDWSASGITSTGNMLMSRTTPSSMSNVDLDGYLRMDGTAASGDLVTITDLAADGVTIAGCGWNVRANDADLGDSTNGVWATASCTSSSASSTLTIAGGTMDGSSSNGNIVYARNAKVTVADVAMTGQTSTGAYVAQASTNGDVRLIGVSWRGNDCADANGWTGMSNCWVDVSSSSGAMYIGGTAQVAAYRVMNFVPVFVADHAVTTTTVSTSGTCPGATCVVSDVTSVGTSHTDSTGNATVWLLQDKLERVSGSTAVSDSYTDHRIAIAGGAGQNETTPADAWYSSTCLINNMDCSMPLSPGDQVFIKLEAFPQDWNGATKDCTFLNTNTSVSNGYYLYTMQIITLSTDLVIDGCKLHLNGTKIMVNRTANNNPTITIQNGGEILLSEGGGEVGHMKAVTSAYGWEMEIQDGGTFVIDNGYIRDMHQNSNTGGAMNVGDGTLELKNGAIVYGSQTTSANMATIKVDGGTLLVNDASVYNAQQTGVGIWIEDSGTSSLQNIGVSGADTGVVIKDAAPSIDGFTLNDNTVGVEIDGGMTLPSIYRSTLLSGQQRGWETYEIDLSGLAENFNYIQFGFNNVYMGGNVHPRYNYYTSRYFAIHDRMRIAVNDGIDDDANGVGDEVENFTTDAAGKLMTGYYHSGHTSNMGDRNNPDHPSRNDGWARYDCNYYGYQYSPGGSYQYGYYYYMNYYGPYTQGNTNYYGANAYPSDFGFTIEKAEGLTGSQNYYPYEYWGYYYNSYHGGYGDFMPPEGYNGLWGSYNVCLSYAYRYQTPTPNGWQMHWPIVDVSSASVSEVKAYMDIMHNYADYYGDRYDFVFRGGSDIDDLMDANWGREFGTASLANGVIDGADTGIHISGNYAAGGIDTVTVNDPVDEGVLVDGSSSVEMNGLTVNNGRYGIRTTAAAAGSLDSTMTTLDNQSQDGIVLASGLKMGLSGSISNAAGAAINVVSTSTKDWDFNSLSLTSNNVALNHDGSGEVTCTDCTTGSNTNDVATSGLVTWIEGDIDLATVSASGSGLLQRARLADITITADGNGVVGTGVSMIDALSKRVASGETDSSGTVNDMVFHTNYVDSSGLTVVNLAGYQIMSVGKVSYSSTVADFRYAIKGVSLVDGPGNSATVTLTDNFDARVCYSWSSTSYSTLQACSGSHYLGTGSSRTKSNGNGGSITEYGYFGAMPTDMKNKAVMIDSPWAYTSTSGASFNGSTVIFSGFYNDEWSDLYVQNYNGDIYLDDTFAAAISPKDTAFFNLGYYGGYNYGNFFVNNSDLINIGAIGSGAGYYNRNPEMHVTNNVIVSYSQLTDVQSVYPEEICVQSAGTDYGDWVVDNNTMYDCTVGIMIYSNYYATSPYYGGTGTDGARWSNNTMYDSTYLPLWIYLNSDADDLLVDNNTVTGSKRVQYGVYAQDHRLNSVEIRGNTLLTADEPIYMRNAKNWDINNNTIVGDSNSAHSGIYVRNGEGTIADNTLTDADGGINVYGVRSGYDVDISRNTIGASGGRVSPTATGIYLENCGLAEVTMSGNHVSTTSNALLSDGCDVSDVGSTFASAGGSASQIHSVNIEASQFNPTIKNISTGDTVRWILTQYNSDPNNYQHTTTSNTSGIWDSGAMNLGSTYAHTFTAPGTYEYHCTIHSFMSGVVNVANSTGTTNLQTYGIDILDGSEDISLDGTTIGGFSLAYRQDGGSLNVEGGSVVTGDNGFDLTNVDVTVDGLSVAADSGVGIGLDVSSDTGRHTLDVANMDTSGSIGMLADGHNAFRWNAGDSTATTTLKTLSGASGTIENMTVTTDGPWRSNHGASLTQINAGAYSTITSVGNTLNESMLTIGTSAVIHEGNLLDLTVTHMGSATSNVGLMIKSTDLGRSEYVSPSWRSNIISVGEGANGAAAVNDWFVSHPLGISNIADDAMPGPVAVNPDPTSEAMGYMTWDNSNLYIMLTGVTFLVTDGMWYLDTQQGGSNVGDNWYVSHNLPFEADYMLWAEDRANWGIRKVMPGGNWVDVTAACTGMQAAPGFGYPGVTPTWSGISEFAIPWDCIGSPTGRIKTLAIIQNENSGHVLGVYPPQLYNQTSGAAQTFGDFGTLQLTGEDLADGTLDDFLLIHRTFTATGATAPRAYDVTVKVRDADNIYWDWGSHSSLAMDQNQDITIDILRAKPVIADLVDVSYDEDTGSHVVTLTDKASDYQQASSTLSWTVTNDATNPSNATSPYAYDLTGQSLTITTDANEFGNQRLYLVVTDGHGLYSSQSMLVGIENVNDAPVINNPRHSAGLPVFTEGIDVNGNAVYNSYDEPQRTHPVTGEEREWDMLTKFLGGAAGEGFVQDLGVSDGLANEQDRNADNNSEQAPQTYTWTAVTDPVDCTPFDVSINGGTTLEIDLNEANEDGGTCNIVLDLSDGASVNDAATTISVPFTLQPTNDNTRIIPWDVNNGSVITTKYLDANGVKVDGNIRQTASAGAASNDGDAWWWSVDEDTEDPELLTIDLTNMMSDNDNTNQQLYWTVDDSQYYLDKCQYTNYFSVTIDNTEHTMEIDLIPDATTDATSAEWDMLQDADGDGVPDDGIHQKAPRSGDYCLMNLILWDPVSQSEVPQYDYVQSEACTALDQDGDATTNCYAQTHSSHELSINVHNLVELRPDYNFNEVRLSPDPFDFKGIDGVLRETMVPVSVELQHTDGDQPINSDGTYKYLYDLQVSFYIVDTDCAGCDGTYQSSVRLGSNGPGNGALALPDYGSTVEVGNYVRLNKTSEDVRVFVDVMTVNPFTGQYTDNSKYERPALEEKNWADNNMTASQTNSELPLIVETKAAQSVASFAPTLMAVGLVGVFVGALLSRSRAEEDEEEFEEESLIDDDRAVSPVIATILLVAITVVLAGVIYVWAGSLADTSTKGVPRLTFSAEAITVQEISGLEQDEWHWRVTTSYAATDLATQAVTVSVLWTNASGQQVYKTALAPGGGDEENVYGFAPRNSENMVTFWDDISQCERGGAPCITTFGPGDRIFIRMTDNDGLIDSALIDIQYELPGGAAYMLKQYTASPTSIR